MMKKLIATAVFACGLSALSHAAPSYGLGSAETMAHLVNVQQGSGYTSVCTYRSATRHYGVHEVQASMSNGCEQQLAYTATWEGGGVLRVFGTSNNLIVRRVGYRAPAKASQPAPTASKYKKLCDNPNMSKTFNQKTGETTDCRTGEVTIDPQIKALKEQGLWPH
ncbi:MULTISPECIES: hypothetical protein [Acinetobacter]|uniref:Uncharacterized protein n=1 Tax=Acinetobacter proteolyticus TaxID=1776741 RepID=A0A653K6M1_9GAMM|nr:MULTISPECIES: hypothetical protein [Acinetobacter]OBY73806.1 hypothetical protein NG55_12650 [Acinetobacter gyllenbergii]VXA56067.1 conserved exported hypothetical protein [Acinetobacter proteolyticus]